MPERRATPAGGPTLAVLAKAPVPGLAKTRLAPRLGPEGAAELHAILLERTLRTALASSFPAVALWCAPHRRAPFFAGVREDGRLALRDQPEGDLGARMRAAVELHLPDAGPVVLVGTDCPELSARHLDAAAAALAGGADAVVVAAADGGYAALGLARAHASLFEGVPWGTAGVMAATRDRLRRLGWAWRELDPLRDVDVPGDVDWLLSTGLLSVSERARLERYLEGTHGRGA